ncbi:sigma 54-interacting transcriptional regulator, partial [Lentisalinibacter sediminis]|uniref:sigma 54-interacting transcriptional regulator n=1 Tax=Lentisalinibacter sediminis TaxID=2992237 RepID=UPI00386C8C71
MTRAKDHFESEFFGHVKGSFTGAHRERVDDIAPLATHFLKVIGDELGRHDLKLTREQLGLLERHDWPGNIRELKNVIERAAISSKGSRVRMDLALPDTAKLPPASVADSNDPDFVVNAGVKMTPLVGVKLTPLDGYAGVHLGRRHAQFGDGCGDQGVG